jgi:hypothetical protein
MQPIGARLPRGYICLVNPLESVGKKSAYFFNATPTLYLGDTLRLIPLKGILKFASLSKIEDGHACKLSVSVSPW